MAEHKLTVKSKLDARRDGGFELALSERDARHATRDNPDGDIFIADPSVKHKVAPTVGVLDAIRTGRLEELSGDEQASQLQELSEGSVPEGSLAGDGTTVNDITGGEQGNTGRRDGGDSIPTNAPNPPKNVRNK